MALVRPTLNAPIVAFDADIDTNISFTVNGGSLFNRSRLTIRNSTTNVVVYNGTQTQTINSNGKYTQTIPSGTLTNGVKYIVVASTLDSDDNESAGSIPVGFWCYTTPTISFVDFSDGDVVTAASKVFTISYNQDEGEVLNAYQLNLYEVSTDSTELVTTSGELYAVAGAPVFTTTYAFSGFEASTSYAIEVTGKTINGTEIESGLVNFTVSYQTPDVYSLMTLENNCEGGYISIQSNLSSIVGESSPTPPTYIDDTEIDLTDYGSYAKWAQGYTIANDMTARIWFRDPNFGKCLFSDTDEEDVAFTEDDGSTTLELTYYSNVEYVNNVLIKTGETTVTLTYGDDLSFLKGKYIRSPYPISQYRTYKEWYYIPTTATVTWYNDVFFYTRYIKCDNMKLYSIMSECLIAQFSNTQGQTIKVYYFEDYPDVNSGTMLAYVRVVVTSITGYEYEVYSDGVTIQASTDYYCLWLEKTDNFYNAILAAI